VVTAAHCVDGWVDVTCTKRLDVPVRNETTEYIVTWEYEMCKMYPVYRINFNHIINLFLNFGVILILIIST